MLHCKKDGPGTKKAAPITSWIGAARHRGEMYQVHPTARGAPLAE
ncbi:hypothetical protein GXY_14972 [Novacetimonas hansenii ATCC 23769]|nr:hypothetical protein GXY_14972 [Novacetimonas hansenii ATCC 23769]